MTTTCFILDELYPSDRGGIARLMHNTIHHAKATNPDHNFHVVLARKKPDDQTLIESFKGIATLHYFRPDFRVAERFGLANLHVSAVFKKQEDPVLREMRVLDAVTEAARLCGGFDHIEIPDHMGLGSILVQAKRAGHGFQNTEITCRIHSTLSAIIDAEPFYHPRNDWLAPRLEMERYAVQNADRVVAHLPSIARFNQAHFEFDESWMDKVEVAFPPVIWPEVVAPPSPPVAKDFIFTARFQPFKRPELFIKAATAMLDGGSDFSGNFRMISYGFDPDYIAYLRLLVPAHHRNRIRIETNISRKERLTAISQGIIVQPSKFESLCALAFEASVERRPLLLAKDCLAFGDDPHWVDQENCLLFAPNPASLAATMEKARHWQPSATVDTRPDASYFALPATPAKRHAALPVGLLIGPINDAKSMEDISALIAPLQKFVSTIQLFGTLLPELAPTDMDYHTLKDSDFQGAQWHRFARELETEAVLLCTPDALPLARFATHGAQVVQPGTAYSSQSKDSVSRQMIIYPGKAKTMNVSDPRICPPCLMLHRNDLDLIDMSDDNALFPRLIARLARSPVGLVLSPAVNVIETAFTESAPDQRLMGHEGAHPWQDGLRWIGVEPKNAARNSLLDIQPITLKLAIDAAQECAAGKPLDLEAALAIAYPLNCDAETDNHVLAFQAIHAGTEGKISVSLQQAGEKEALAQHKQGKNCRVLKPGQAYQMRWGPLWESDVLTLVVSADITAKLRLDNPILISIP